MRCVLGTEAWMVVALLPLLLAAASCSDGGERVRHPVVAGAFYPSSPTELRADVDKYLAQGAEKVPPDPQAIALVAPHAGYPYSGRCAGHAYAAVKGRTFKRVVVLALNHRGEPFRGASILDVEAYRTPLGEVPVDRAACDKLLKHKLFGAHPSADRREHSLEVQLPFLQQAIGSFQLVPIVVGYLRDADHAAVAAAVREVVDDETLVVASTDFTHYGLNFRFAPFEKDVRANIEKLDKGAADLLVKLDGKGFREYLKKTGATICGHCPVGVLIALLPAEAEGKLVCYYCSGDEERDYRHSVSYAGIVFRSANRWQGAPKPEAKASAHEPQPGDVSLAGQRKLLAIARKTLAAVASARDIPKFELDDAELQGKQGVFVSLHKFGDLCGCIGNFQPSTPLYRTVAAQACESALHDRRFPPVEPDEVKDIEIEVSILMPAEPIKDPLGWEFGTHGIIVRRGGTQATFLPQVAEQFPDKETMLAACCRKAGLPPAAWRDKDTQVLLYRAQVFDEAELEETP